MGHRSNVAPTGRDFYFSPAGQNVLSGLSFENAVQDPAQAIALVNALDPPVSAGNRASMISSASGSYTAGLVLPSFTTIDAATASVLTFDAVNITAGDSQPSVWGALLNFSSGCVLYLIDGRTQIDATVSALIVGGVASANCTGFDVRGTCGDVFVRVTTGSLSGDGAVLIKHTATSVVPFDYNIDSVNFFGTNQTLIEYNPPNTFDQASLNITAAQTDFFSTTTGSMLFGVKSGRLIVKAEVLRAESICTVESAAEFSLDMQIGLGDVLVKTGGEMVLDAGILVGDITVEAGGVLNASVRQHVGDVVCNGVINGCINGEPYGNAQEQVVLHGSDFTNQVPTGLDAPMQILFGPAQGTASDPVMLSAAGALTINRKKKYLLDVIVQYSRDNAGAAAWLFFRIKKNGAHFGNSIFAKLDNSNSDLPVQFSSRLDLAAGDVLTFEMMRDSQGFDDGELLSTSPTPGDWAPVPSASITVTI